MQRIPAPQVPQPLTTVPAPRVPVPAPMVTIPRPLVPIPAPVVPAPAVPIPAPVVPTPAVTVPALTVPIPAARGQPIITPQRPAARNEAPTPRMAITPTPPQGGILRQFGGGAATVTVSPQAVTAPKITIVTETALTILTRLTPVWNGTPEQIQQLIALRYATGSPIIDVRRRDIIIEIIGMLTRNPFAEIMEFLTDAPTPEFVLWEQSSLDEGRIKVEREIMIQQAEEVGVRGVGKCRFCPSTELVFAQRQLRSGDEPATVFVRCVMCTKQWRQ